MTLLALLSPSGAQAQDIPNHRLDFAADRSLHKCDQALSFLGLITRWVPLEVFNPPYKRDLVVRLQRAPNGAKMVDVTIRDMAGATKATLHKTWPPDEECFLMLHQTASDAAKLMTTSVEKVRESVDVSTAAQAAEALPTPTNSAFVTDPPTPAEQQQPRPVATTTSIAQPPRRGFVGAGMTFTYGITSEWAPGPRIIGGFAPLQTYPRFTVEFDIAMPIMLSARPSVQTNVQVFAPSLRAAPCYVRLPLRFCALVMSGLIAASGVELDHDDRSIGLLHGLGLRAGVDVGLTRELPLSLRLDADVSYVGRTALLESRYHKLSAPIPVNVDVAAALAWWF